MIPPLSGIVEEWMKLDENIILHVRRYKGETVFPRTKKSDVESSDCEEEGDNEEESFDDDNDSEVNIYDDDTYDVDLELSELDM